MRFFAPREECATIFDVDYESLWNRGMRGLIFDLDNTLCSWHASSLDESVRDLLGDLRERGFRLCILSNGNLDNRHGILEDLTRQEIPVFYPAKKPLPIGFKRAQRFLDLNPKEVAVIGDQLLTDVLGGNLLGFYTILVEPLCPREHPWTKHVSRLLERLLGRKFKRQSSPAGVGPGYPVERPQPSSRRDRKE